MKRRRPAPLVIPRDNPYQKINYELCRDVISQVDKRLYVGNINSVAKDILEMYDIGAIVSIQKHKLPIDTEIPILRVYIDDAIGEDIMSLLDIVADFIDLQVNLKRNVLIHCTAGVSRSPTFTIAYLMKYRKMRLGDALNLMKIRRACSSPNFTFLKQIENWKIE
jgi:protein-tyrosine phosphatase